MNPFTKIRNLRLEFHELLLVGLGLFMVAKYLWICDDGYIYYRYVDNWVIHKAGLVFNPGEYVEGFSGVLWVVGLSILRVFIRFLTLRHLTFILGFLFAVLTMATLVSLNRQVLAATDGSRPRNPGRLLLNFSLPLAFLVSTRTIAEFFTSGLETPLVLLFTALVARQILLPSENSVYVGLLAGAGPLVRPELSLFSGILIIHYFLFVKKAGAARVLVLAALPNLIVVGLRIWYYASLLPDVYYTKASAGANILQGLNYLRDVMVSYKTHLLFGAAVLVLLLSIRLQSPRLTRRRLVLFASVLIYAAYVVWLGGDYMHGRFWLPALVALYAGLSGLLEPLVDRIAKRFRPDPWAQKVVSLGMAALVVAVMLPLRSPMKGKAHINRIFNEREWEVEFDHQDIRAWNFRPTNELFVRAIRLKKLANAFGMPVTIVYSALGYLGYYSTPNVRIIDPLGLTDVVGARVSVIHRSYPGHEKWAPDPYIAWKRPTFWQTPFAPYNDLFRLIPDAEPLLDFDPVFLQKAGAVFHRDLLGQVRLSLMKVLESPNPDPNLLYFLRLLTDPYPQSYPEIRAKIAEMYVAASPSPSPWEAWLTSSREKLELMDRQVFNRHNLLENIGIAWRTHFVRFPPLS